MKRRKIAVVCALIVCLFLLLPAASFAEERVTLTAETDGGMNVTATTQLQNRPSFTVQIPQTIPIGEVQRAATDGSYSEKNFEVSLTGGETLGDRSVSVRVSTADGTFRLYSGSYVLPYELKRGDTTLASGDVFATFTAEQTTAVTGKIVIDRYDIVAAGDYTGVLTFTVAVGDVTP